MTWAKNRGYAMLDVNVLERPYPKQRVSLHFIQLYSSSSNPCIFSYGIRTTMLERRWFIFGTTTSSTFSRDRSTIGSTSCRCRLSDARRIILIGHGPGCAPVMSLIQQRGEYPLSLSCICALGHISSAASSVMKTVCGVVQVVGLHTIPATPRDMAELRTWYYDVRSQY